MNRILITCLTLLLFTNTYCQSNNAFDSLKKYSYFIEGINSKDGVIATGTGFFIRTKDSLIYLITAKHVLSGCNDSLLKFKGMPPIMYVFLDLNGNIIPINTNRIKDTSQCLPMISSP